MCVSWCEILCSICVTDVQIFIGYFQGQMLDFRSNNWGQHNLEKMYVCVCELKRSDVTCFSCLALIWVCGWLVGQVQDKLLWGSSASCTEHSGLGWWKKKYILSYSVTFFLSQISTATDDTKIISASFLDNVWRLVKGNVTWKREYNMILNITT